MRHAFFIVLLALILSPLSLSAQEMMENLTIKIRPDRPRAKEAVTVELETFAFDLQNSSISWTLNGSLAKTAIGGKTFTFTTGSLGSVSQIGVSVTTIDGHTFSKSIEIRPAEVNLVWEADVYTPPFYKGRSYFTHESYARVIAEPSIYSESGARISPSNLIYTWKENGKVYLESSGYGKNVFYAPSKLPFRPISIEVEVTSADKKYVASANLSLTAQTPFVLFYENHPVYGILYNKALGNEVSFAGEEFGIAAVPFNFSIADRNIPQLEYKWSMNNIQIDHRESNVVLRKPASSGRATVSLQIANIAALFQFANQSLSVGFEKEEAGGFSDI